MRAINKALRIARIRKEDGGPIDVNAAMPEAYQDPNVGLGAGIRNAITGLATLPRRAIENSQESLNTGNYDPSAPLEAAMTVMGGSGAVPASANELRMGIKAYHGSPHDFDAFDLSKIGTGEGAQAYGHGLYFADSEGVARSYRDQLAAGYDLKVNGQEYNSSDPSHLAAMNMDTFGKRGKTRQEIADILREDSHLGQRYTDAADLLQSGKPLPEFTRTPSGRMYEVNINADPEHFLDWDKPLSEQPELFGRLKDSGVINDKSPPHQISGQATPKALFQMPVEKGSVEGRVSDLGIPGIKYLDQGSRGQGRLPWQQDLPQGWSYFKTGDGGVGIKDARGLIQTDVGNTEAEAHRHLFGPQPTSNYVVFNDKLIDILRKYGIAGLPAGLAAASTQGNDDHMARGGSTRTALRMATGGNVPFAGYIPGSTGGRTDNKPINVQEGSYVVPADILSGLGEGNSHAGWAALQAQFGMGQPPMKADGGAVGSPVPIVAASGEGVIPPDVVSNIGGGDLDRGHSILDALVKHVRKKTIKTLRKLPSPKKN